MEISKEVQACALWVADTMKKSLPDALMLGITFPFSLVVAAAQREDEPGFTPAFLVADNILDTSGRYNFIEALKFRRHKKIGLWNEDLDEVQGYADVISAFTCWSLMEAGQLWGDIPISQIFQESPTLLGLSENVRESAIIFVDKHSNWARARIKPSDVVDGRNIMPKIGALVSSGTNTASYKKGAETAYQTFQLYVLLVLNSLAQQSKNKSPRQ
jgi:hypothetical protein